MSLFIDGDLGDAQENSEWSFAGVEPTAFRFLVGMLFHWATGDSWELGN